MKKFSLITLVLVLCLGLVGCGENSKKGATGQINDEENKSLIVFAAASMTETMEELKDTYEKENSNIEIVYTFDSSGTLKTQIEEGAKVDLFISAAQKQMNALDPSVGDVETEYVINPETRIDLLENKVVLAAPEGNPKDVSEFSDIGNEKVEKVALGNSDVPVGQYSEELLRNLGIWDEIQEKVSYGSNVKEVTTWVDESVVDCGIIYKTDAFSAGLEVVNEADESMLDNKVIYPVAILEKTENKEEALKFLEFLKSEKASEVFQSVGFSPIN